MRTIIRIYDFEQKETKLLMDSRSHKIYSEFITEGIGTKEIESAFEERFAPATLEVRNTKSTRRNIGKSI